LVKRTMAGFLARQLSVSKCLGAGQLTVDIDLLLERCDGLSARPIAAAPAINRFGGSDWPEVLGIRLLLIHGSKVKKINWSGWPN
jgi:hypothetical protein